MYLNPLQNIKEHIIPDPIRNPTHLFISKIKKITIFNIIGKIGFVKVSYFLKPLTFFIFISSYCPLFSQTSEWNLRKNNDGIQVYTRNHPGSNILEFKAITTLSGKIDKVKKVVTNVNGSIYWMERIIISKLLKTDSKGNMYAYYEMNVPWPLENRDVVVLQKIKKQTQDSLLIVISSIPEYYPEQENITRIKIAKGHWELIKLQDNKTKIIYTFYSDPGGNIPTWIVNLFIIDSPYKTMKNLKQMFNNKN